MTWDVVVTERFSEEFKKFSKDKQFLDALDKKIKRLCQDPNIGGHLSGKLHSYKSIRLLKNFRILYRIDEKEMKVYLVAIDHRGYDYKRYNL